MMPPTSTFKESGHSSNGNTTGVKIGSNNYTEENVDQHPNKFVKKFNYRLSSSSHFDTKISFGRRPGNFKPKKNFSNKHSNYLPRKNDAEKFRYGNYHQYYGYRNHGTSDSRLLCMKREWFSGKEVLDVGCNAGHLTLTLARDFAPKFIIGIDIDNELVKMAMKNVRHYVNLLDTTVPGENDFPISYVYSYGPIAQAADPRKGYPTGNFPFNVQFLQGNYIPPSDELLDYQEAFFDTVLCLSLTKWIHLNWGDIGIKRLFHRMYAHLRPGGFLILEAQEWRSYAKRKKVTETALKHHKEIKLYPEMFNEYLINEVGFVSCELIDTPAHSSKGFSRPIYLFTKGQDIELATKLTPKHTIYKENYDSNYNDSDIEEFSD